MIEWLGLIAVIGLHVGLVALIGWDAIATARTLNRKD